MESLHHPCSDCVLKELVKRKYSVLANIADSQSLPPLDYREHDTATARYVITRLYTSMYGEWVVHSQGAKGILDTLKEALTQSQVG